MPSRRKNRTAVPPSVSGRILFLSDRTCCVCRIKGKRVQLHHIDENPDNHDPNNLAVLCFDCHDLTQVKGGFGRKLDADQILLYRNDWIQIVARERLATEAAHEQSSA